MMGEVGFPQLFFTLMDGWISDTQMDGESDRAQTQEENVWQNQGISTAGDQ